MPADDALLRALAFRYPTREATLAAMAELTARLPLPKGAIHVVSDVHGEDQKLSHILRNGSGSLRPLVESVFGDALPEAERTALLSVVYYPREAMRAAFETLDAPGRKALVHTMAERLVRVLKALSGRYTARDVEAVVPEAYRTLFRELVMTPAPRSPAFFDAALSPFVADEDGGISIVRVLAHAVRDLTVAEVIVAGDLGDRGPRLDRVIGALQTLTRVSLTWGNHDASWLGATLGQPACLATVVRISLRYGRISQLEEGFGIPVEPLEQLARAVYGDDPAERFRSKGEDLRDPLLLARMQKAIAIIQLKLEGQLSQRNPHFEMEHRQLLHRLDLAAGTVTIDEKTYPLLDTRFPTVDARAPYALTPAEESCLARLQTSFFDSAVLWDQQRWVERHGAMIQRRDDTVIFHGCVPVDDAGAPLSFAVDGKAVAGRALFEALETVVRRAIRKRRPEDLDVLYWLWAGARSPLFGKDRMATFETYFVADKATHEEKKNPYFGLLHDRDFCRRILVELGGDGEKGLIVNGHVPVKLEKGESALKRSGMAVTIDGAFSEAYGDKGYTLVLEAGQTTLAQHHHFTSIDDSVRHGTDIVPITTVLRTFDPPRTIGDTDEGARLRDQLAALGELSSAYRDGRL